ncbi:MAG: GNAT family N-acetyltransferase [Chloroflexota bacterium]|nr:GNAT family N-acetyltransferase [Chloroflexota bacterium]
MSDIPMSVELLEHRAEWENYVASSDEGTFYHSLKWQAVLEDVLGTETHYLAFRDMDAGVLVGICPFAISRNAGVFKILDSLPDSDFGGPLISTGYGTKIGKALADQIRLLSREKGIAYTKMRCTTSELSHMLKTKDSRIETPVGTMNLNLSHTTPDIIWEKHFSKKSGQRKFIRRCEQAGFQNREMQDKRDLASFYAIYKDNLQHIGTPPYPYHFFQELYNRLYPDHFNILLTTDGHNCLAAQGFFAFASRKALYLTYLGLDRKLMKQLHPSDHLHWGTIQWAQNHGFEQISFGSTPSDPQSHQRSAKSRFGAAFNQDYVLYTPLNTTLFTAREWAVNIGRRMEKKLPKQISGRLFAMGRNL